MAAEASVRAPKTTTQTPAANLQKSTSTSQWEIWKQVVIAEVLNVLENRRYEASL